VDVYAIIGPREAGIGGQRSRQVRAREVDRARIAGGHIFRTIERRDRDAERNAGGRGEAGDDQPGGGGWADSNAGAAGDR